MVNRNLNDGLPAFLVSNPGLNSGFMIPQYTAAGLMNEIKHLAVPATIDSIPTCAGQEDPVSMGYYASKKALMGVKKLQYVTAIEIYVALQAMDFLKPLEPSPVLGKLRDFIRKEVPLSTTTAISIPTSPTSPTACATARLSIWWRTRSAHWNSEASFPVSRP